MHEKKKTRHKPVAHSRYTGSLTGYPRRLRGHRLELAGNNKTPARKKTCIAGDDNRLLDVCSLCFFYATCYHPWNV